MQHDDYGKTDLNGLVKNLGKNQNNRTVHTPRKNNNMFYSNKFLAQIWPKLDRVELVSDMTCSSSLYYKVLNLIFVLTHF